jgi:hypothetical protein
MVLAEHWLEMFLFTRYVFVDLLLTKRFSLGDLAKHFQFAMTH